MAMAAFAKVLSSAEHREVKWSRMALKAFQSKYGYQKELVKLHYAAQNRR